MSYNKKILHSLILLSAMFLGLTLYLTVFLVSRGPTLANDGGNPRTLQKENKIKRGDIFDRDGEALAYSEFDGGVQKRKYPHGSLYAHVIGYNSQRYGRSMLESSYNGYILGLSFTSSVFNLKERLGGGGLAGADITLTVSNGLQKKAHELLGKRRGAVVAMNPKTGEVLAMVSKPDFDPNEGSLLSNWESMAKDENSPFLSRAIGGLYPPGSVFKPLIAAAAIESGMDANLFDDKGKINIGGHEFKNYNEKAYGEIDMKRALAVSSNAYFVDLADKLGEHRIRTAAEKFWINRELPFDIQAAKSRVFTGNPGRTDIAAVGMGQGDALVTPLHMAVITSAFANDGVLMRPYIVDSARVKNAAVFKQKSESLGRAVSSYAAEKVTEMMVECVKSGTGTGAALSKVTVAGKTGTAENAGEDHAWFVGFAPADNPKIAVAVIIENAGRTGGELGAPIARELIRYWLDK